MRLLSRSTGETNKIATELARKITRTASQKHAVVLALEGELGAGKTTFVKAFAKALGIKSHITSPTFVLMKHYQLPRTATQWGKPAISYQLLIHIDAYRLKDYHELLALGIKEAITDPKNIILIEWAERVRPILPKKYIKIHIDHIDLKTRKITIV